MTQTIPLSMTLGAANTDLTIGYRVLNLDRTVYSDFTIDNVIESDVLGTYYVESGIVAPDEGGYVVVGTALVDYAEAGIDPANTAPTAEEIDAQLSAAHGADSWESGDVTATVTVSAADAEVLAAGDLLMPLRTYYTWEFSITSTSTEDLSGASDIYVALKNKDIDTDANALVLISRDSGLLYINKAAATTPTNGALTITGSVGAWVITGRLESAETGKLTAWKGRQFAEAKCHDVDEDALIWNGKCVVALGIVQKRE